MSTPQYRELTVGASQSGMLVNSPHRFKGEPL